MTALLLAATLFAGVNPPAADDKGDAHANVDGKWLIVYAERGGRRNNTWEQQQAMLQGGTLSYEAEGKQHSLKLTFGPHQTVKASGGEEGGDGKERSGVYVAGQDYLCISLGGGDAGRSSGSFILILRRQR